MKPIFALLLLSLLSACAIHRGHEPPGSVDDAAEKVAVLAAMDRYMTAISAKDYATMIAMNMPNSMTWSARPGKDGKVEPVPRPNNFWTDPANQNSNAHRERYWSPTVLMRGPLAVVWAPYEFWVNGKTSHCGVDVFDFVKVEGKWRVANAMWTVEAAACESLRPNDGAQIRPVD